MEKLVTEIHGFFPEFNMSLNDLKNPTPTFVRDFYSRVLIELGVDSDNVRKAQIDQLEYAQDIDLLPILNLITAINSAFPFLNINLFDMLQPAPKRNAMLMSKVMNFMEFCEVRIAGRFEEYKKFQETKEYENHLMEILEVKAREVNDFACELESCKQEKEDLRAKIESLENGIDENRKHNTSLSEAIHRLQEKLVHLDKEGDSLKCEISSINSEIEALKSQIVRNPNEEKREFDTKLRHKDRVLAEKKELEDKLKENKEIKEKMQHQVEIIERRVAPILKELDILRTTREMEVKAQKAKNKLEELLEKKEKNLSNLEEIRHNIEIEKNNFKTQLSVLEKEEESERMALEEKKNDCALKLKENRRQQKYIQEELSSVNKEILNLEKDYNELRSKFIIAKQAINSQMAEITQRKFTAL